MSTDEAHDELSRAVRDLRELVEQVSTTRYIQIGSVSGPRFTSDPIVTSTRFPDYVTLDDLQVTSEPSAYRVEVINQILEGEGTLHVLDENGRCSACEGRSGGRNWVAEINDRSARDAELQAQRYAAYQRAEAVERALYQQEDAQWSEVRARQEHGETIPERPIVLSWLAGPEVTL